MKLYIDTCVLPRSSLETAAYYRTCCSPRIGFELLPMFDLPSFEENLRQNMGLLAEGPLIFHEPVWGVEHTAEDGTAAYEESMYHLRLTRKYADLLQPTHMVYHFSNCRIQERQKEHMLSTSLKNLDRMRSWFPYAVILAENTGIKKEGTLLLDQDEFTGLCREFDLTVLIDTGHANANGWDLRKLITDLKDRICGFHLHNNDGIHDMHARIHDGTLDFDSLMPFILETVPEAFCVIEYVNPKYHGDPLMEDIRYLQKFEGDGT